MKKREREKSEPEPGRDLRRVGRNLTGRCAGSWRISSPEYRTGLEAGSIRRRSMVGWIRRPGRFRLRHPPRRHRLDYPPITAENSTNSNN